METNPTQIIKKKFTGKVIYSAGASLIRTNLSDANLTAADLAGANLAGASLIRANLTRANLIRANLAYAVLAYANLSDASLTAADLTRASLAGANLAGASLIRANLAGASLVDAVLTRANLADTVLAGANLAGANLAGASLIRANLTRANLIRTNLSDASLIRANLSYAVGLTYEQLMAANLAAIKDDFCMRLDCVPVEVAGLRAALVAGRVDGSCYEGDCCCFVGTIANLRGVDFDSMPELKPNNTTPTERWFLAISKGDTVENNPIVRITVEWIDEWMAAREVKA